MTQATAKSDTRDWATVFCGLCMGCADVVPGVSGGTVALILGIYARLVTALSRVDRELWRLVSSRQGQAAWAYLDFRFLAALGAGIGAGVIGMSLLVNKLLSHEFSRALTLAAFFGMILASAVLVARLIQTRGLRQRIACVALALAAATVACWLALLPHHAHHGGAPSFAWLFACGSIAICAMILPGISGAMILLLLGVYEHLTEIPDNLISGERIGASLVELIVFASGCGLSLVLFSKLLRWLLANRHAATMSALCGFMFGALPKLWPFQIDQTPEIKKFKEKTFQLVLPQQLDAKMMIVLVTVVIAVVFVFAVNRAIHRKGTRQA